MKNQEQYLPGYPHYPADEDITRNAGKVRTDTPNETAPTLTNNDADITAEDLQLLVGSENNMGTTDDNNLQRSVLDAFDDEGELLNESSIAGEISGIDLDVPGSKDDDKNEEIGEEDEENNYYSLGGDNHEAQEENNRE